MAAIAHMTVSNRQAAAILRAHGVHAATDVTGFGLLGHLVEMVRASRCRRHARHRPPCRLLEARARPLRCGIFSSLQPQNVRLRRAIRNLDEAAARHPLYPLLFDPQTAGGLLASVPLEQAERASPSFARPATPRRPSIGFVSSEVDRCARAGDARPACGDERRDARALARTATRRSRAPPVRRARPCRRTRSLTLRLPDRDRPATTTLSAPGNVRSSRCSRRFSSPASSSPSAIGGRTQRSAPAPTSARGSCGS